MEDKNLNIIFLPIFITTDLYTQKCTNEASPKVFHFVNKPDIIRVIYILLINFKSGSNANIHSSVK